MNTPLSAPVCIECSTPVHTTVSSERCAFKRMTETAWLIESRISYGDGRPRWWMGTGNPAPWTADSLEAVRFCRRRDAEAAMATLPDSHTCFVSEHEWGLGS